MATSLMDTGTQSYAALLKKYHQFLTPAARVKIDGRELPAGVGVSGLEVTLSLENASAVRFDVVGAYDLASSGFRSNVIGRLKLGARLSVSLGYDSALTEVFSGYISEMSVSFSDAPQLSVSAMDVRGLMMEGSSCEEVHQVTSNSAAFEKIMARYRAVCSRLKIDATNEKDMTQSTQRVSDYEYIQRYLAEKSDREFFVMGDTAYFRDRQKMNKTSITTLRWGEGLIRFSRHAFYKNTSIEILGYDQDSKQAVSAKQAVLTAEPQKNVVAKAEITEVDPNAHDVEKARRRAQKRAEQQRKKAQSASGQCVGLPELVPGRYLGIVGLDKNLDGKYYLSEVRHSFGEGGFETSFEIAGWE